MSKALKNGENTKFRSSWRLGVVPGLNRHYQQQRLEESFRWLEYMKWLESAVASNPRSSQQPDPAENKSAEACKQHVWLKLKRQFRRDEIAGCADW